MTHILSPKAKAVDTIVAFAAGDKIILKGFEGTEQC